MIINGNSLEELKKFPDNYFHSVVTDPPYGLSFMGKKWDYDVPSVELWKEVFRVLKEGGYLLSFAGTRTQHRMAVNIEDAGFEIRDMIAWVYGSGFPKSHNIGKAVDKHLGNERTETKLKSIYYDNSERKFNTGKQSGKNVYGDYARNKLINGKVVDTLPASEEAKQWEGWGTALKPALEPITIARKPFKGTVANNVLTNGVGGINIDGCRVEHNDKKIKATSSTGFNNNTYKKGEGRKYTAEGRFPANFIHDGSDEVKDLFPETSPKNKNVCYGVYNENNTIRGHNDKGTAARFFYCAKASKKDRNEGLEDKIIVGRDEGQDKLTSPRKPRPILRKNYHPTVKPTDLMRYLVRLVTPKNGIVLDCFMGSGSTGKACTLEGFEFVGIDLDKDYCEIAKARIDKALEEKKQAEAQQELF